MININSLEGGCLLTFKTIGSAQCHSGSAITIRYRLVEMYRPLKNKSRLQGCGSLGQMSMGINMGFLNDRTVYKKLFPSSFDWVFGLSVPLK